MLSRNKKESDKALKKCNYTCVVCGWNRKDLSGKSLVVGAHVRPFSNAPEFDKYDNIIALCPNCHSEFDSFTFYIEPETHTVHYIDKSHANEGKNISSSISYVKKNHLVYAKYLFDLNNKKEKL